jgi:hypothetical protein
MTESYAWLTSKTGIAHLFADGARTSMCSAIILRPVGYKVRTRRRCRRCIASFGSEHPLAPPLGADDAAL